MGKYLNVNLPCPNILQKLRNVILSVTALLWFLPAAYAENLGPSTPFNKYSSPHSAVLAVQTGFETRETQIRVIAYDREDAFLMEPVARYDATLDASGLAIVGLPELASRDHAFVVYLDENRDGKLNRNVLGKPKEPYVFSNGVKPKLRKPTFEEAKVSTEHGRVIVITLHK